MCKKLSLWWSSGIGEEPRDDIFWRSAQSGGRATQRAKSGKSTFGSYGDIAAVDPIGQPLMRVLTIELKRGSTIGTPWDLFDTSPTKAIRPIEAGIAQAIRSHKDAGSLSWVLIGRRDHRVPIVYGDSVFLREFFITPGCGAYCMMKLHLNGLKGERRIIGIHLDEFLKVVTPEEIIRKDKYGH